VCSFMRFVKGLHSAAHACRRILLYFAEDLEKGIDATMCLRRGDAWSGGGAQVLARRASDDACMHLAEPGAT